ncbi:MAG TPA: M56 family metallopeptidase, partial [Planctomycetota bacterium]
MSPAWLLENSLVAGPLALAVALFVRLCAPRPAVAHCLWLATLGVLLMPRLPWIETPGAALRRELRAQLGLVPTAPAEPVPVGPQPSAVDLLRLAATATDEAPAAAARVAAPVAAAPAGLGRAAWIGPALGLAWLAGALVVLVRSLRRIAPFQRLVRRSPRAPRELCAEVRHVARALGVRAPEVRLVAGVASPSIWCLGRPRLLWPAGAPDLGARARRALIAHELAHLARRDHWVSWLDLPAAALAWWNPLFWWIRGHVRHFAELSCDAWAVWAYPADRRFFAEALLELQATTRTAHVPLQGLGATDSECKDFERRLDMIMRKGTFPRVSRSAMLAAAVVAALAAPGFSVGGEETCSAPAPVVAAVEARAKSVKLSDEAVQLLKDGDSKGALALLRELVALEPENAWAHGRIGLLLVDAGELDAARASFLRQYELGHDRPTALY